MPKVSIIVPIYGAEKYLEQCLDSLINQSLGDIEIVCVDDGGKDKCPEIIDAYAKRHGFIKAIHKQNAGYGAACNTGLDNASGEYIAVVEPDDFVDSEMYAHLYDLAKVHKLDIAKSNLNKYEEETGEITKFKWLDAYEEPKGVFTIEDYPWFLAVHPSTVTAIYRRQFLIDNGIRWTEAPGAGWTDNPFQVQTMCRAKSIAYTDKAFYNWRCLAGESVSMVKPAVILDRMEEIHTWISYEPIKETSEQIAMLCKRHLKYIISILKQEHSTNDMLRSSMLCLRMPEEVIFKSKHISTSLKMFFAACRKDISFAKTFVDRGLV